MLTSRHSLGALALVGAVIVAIGFWLRPEPSPPVEPYQPQPGIDSSTEQNLTVTGESPFSVSAQASDDALTDDQGNASASEVDTAGGSAEQTTIELPQIDVSTLAQETISDSDFEALVARLRADPVLLQQVIDEFRQEQDPERLSRLVQLLGDVGGEPVTLLASELVYSGDAAARKLGLSLLRRIQPGNEEALNIASGLLATEVESDVLIGTMTSLAEPGLVDDSSREFLSDQVAYLSGHDDPAVRSISLTVLSRWSSDGRYTNVLLGGLDDTVPTVREAAAYAMVGHESVDQSVIDHLLSVTLNPEEDEAVRRATLLALRGMNISDEQRQQLMEAERVMDRVTRR